MTNVKRIGLYWMCWLQVALLVCGCDATPRAATVSEVSATETSLYTPSDCKNPDWTYHLAVPSRWRSVPTTACEVQFRDPLVASNGPAAPDDSSESEFFAGGVGVRGPIDTASAEADGVEWPSMQPNHSMIVEWLPVDTPLGPGRVYTLDRDRAVATQSAENPMWRGQYAYVPHGDWTYEVWVRVDNAARGAVDPTLARMLETLDTTRP